MDINAVLSELSCTKNRLSKILNVSASSIQKWESSGIIPERWSMRLQYEILPALRKAKAEEAVAIEKHAAALKQVKEATEKADEAAKEVMEARRMIESIL